MCSPSNPAMPMASDALSPAALHSSRNSSKRPPEMSAWTRNALPHSRARGAMRIAVRPASSAGSASATRRARSQLSSRRARCRGWPPTPRRACASRRRRAGPRRPPDARRSGRHSRPPRPGHAASIAAASAPVQLSAIGLELSLVGDRANQRVVEHILGLPGKLDLIDELGRHQVVNDRFNAQPVRAGPG